MIGGDYEAPRGVEDVGSPDVLPEDEAEEKEEEMLPSSLKLRPEKKRRREVRQKTKVGLLGKTWMRLKRGEAMS